MNASRDLTKFIPLILSESTVEQRSLISIVNLPIFLLCDQSSVFVMVAYHNSDRRLIDHGCSRYEKR